MLFVLRAIGAKCDTRKIDCDVLKLSSLKSTLKLLIRTYWYTTRINQMYTFLGVLTCFITQVWLSRVHEQWTSLFYSIYFHHLLRWAWYCLKIKNKKVSLVFDIQNLTYFHGQFIIVFFSYKKESLL